ncbi:glycosyltransferase [Croceibacterium ferulae]|uniref:glycosyltransferase n=1 Tax=Croceibacterium ferulae TaxID=1854641 RepID=UPI0013903808|nr:glycosyltransferase [Croceibacterium ferulae]
MTTTSISTNGDAPSVVKSTTAAFLDPVYDVVFVVNYNSRGWILEKICKVISESLKLQSTIIYTERNDRISGWVPPARMYFFSHYKLFTAVYAKESLVRNALNYVWFTHPNFIDAGAIKNFVTAMQHADGIFTANSNHRRALEFLGLEPQRLHTIIGGADSELFTYKARSGRAVGIVGAYYERKCPDLLLAVIKAAPDMQFLLLAPDPSEIANARLSWNNFANFDALLSCENLTYVTAKYEDFPRYFKEIDIYLSLSNLEGGPIPLVEAMFSNCVPVATRTGFVEDLVVDKVNGRILDCEPKVDAVIEALRWAASDVSTDVRSTVLDFSWSAFGSNFASVMDPTLPLDKPVAADQHGLLRGILREGWTYNPVDVRFANGGVSPRLVISVPEGCESLRIDLEIDPIAGRSSVPLEITLDGVLIASLEGISGFQQIVLPVHFASDRTRLTLIFSIDGPPEEAHGCLCLVSIEALSAVCTEKHSALFPRFMAAPDALADLNPLSPTCHLSNGSDGDAGTESVLPATDATADDLEYQKFKNRKLTEKLHRARSERDKYLSLREQETAALKSQKEVLAVRLVEERNRVKSLASQVSSLEKSSEELAEKNLWLSDFMRCIPSEPNAGLFRRALNRFVLRPMVRRAHRAILLNSEVNDRLGEAGRM